MEGIFDTETLDTKTSEVRQRREMPAAPAAGMRLLAEVGGHVDGTTSIAVCSTLGSICRFVGSATPPATDLSALAACRLGLGRGPLMSCPHRVRSAPALLGDLALAFCRH